MGGNCCVECKRTYQLWEGTAVWDISYKLWEGTAVWDISYKLWEGTAVLDVREVINSGRELLCRMQEKL